MHSDTILDSHLYIRPDLTPKANRKFQADTSNKAHLASQLLLYDRIVIPSKDFGIIPILIDWMGLDRFREALDESALGFARPMSILGYAGNGNGISAFVIGESEKLHFDWWQDALFGSMDKAAELQLERQCPFIGAKDRSKLLQLILLCSKSIDWNNDVFMKSIVHESYADIMGHPVLSSFVIRHEPSGTTSVKLPWLTGVSPNQLRVSSLRHIRDGVDLVLRIAEINLEVMMAHIYGECDIGTSDGAQRILERKLYRYGIHPTAESKFMSLIELTGTPDIRPAISSGSMEFAEIMKLRQKKASREFRKWLRNARADDARDLERLYVSSLGNSAAYSSLPSRILRFIITTAVGIINPIAGPVASVVDSFFVEKWLDGYSPKLFLDELGKLPN